MQGFWSGFEKQAKQSKSHKKDKSKYNLLAHFGAMSLGGAAGVGLGSLTNHPKGKAIGGALGALAGGRSYRRTAGE